MVPYVLCVPMALVSYRKLPVIVDITIFDILANSW